MAEQRREQRTDHEEERPDPEIAPLGVELSEDKRAPGPHWEYSEFERPQPNTQRQEPGTETHATNASFLPRNQAVVQRSQDEPAGRPESDRERQVRLMRTNPQYAQTQHERRRGLEEADPDTLSPEQEPPVPPARGASRADDKPFSQGTNRR